MLFNCGIGDDSFFFSIFSFFSFHFLTLQYCIGLDCKEIQPVHSEGDQPQGFLERMMLKLKLQYFGHLM